MIKTNTIIFILLSIGSLPIQKNVAARDLGRGLWAAICTVESSNNPQAKGDWNQKTKQYEAIGIAQIRPIFVDDCNRIIGFKKWTYVDRWRVDKSRQMFDCYLGRYGKDKSLEGKSRIFNGGPKGDKKKATLNYWSKVKKELK